MCADSVCYDTEIMRQNVLEKIIVHNISYKTFQKDAPHIRSVDRKDESGKDKGSLVMFAEWLSKNIRTQENLEELIIKPLKNIRNIRQKLAHELTSNEYDVTLYPKQFKLINDTYTAIRAIRLNFANHPLAKDEKSSKALGYWKRYCELLETHNW